MNTSDKIVKFRTQCTQTKQTINVSNASIVHSIKSFKYSTLRIHKHSDIATVHAVVVATAKRASRTTVFHTYQFPQDFTAQNACKSICKMDFPGVCRLFFGCCCFVFVGKSSFEVWYLFHSHYVCLYLHKVILSR